MIRANPQAALHSAAAEQQPASPAARQPLMAPVYELYGSTQPAALPEALHWESIAARSRLFDWEIRPHRHARFFQIVYLWSGAGVALLPGLAPEERSLGPGSVLAIPPGGVHGFRFEPEVHGGVLTIVRDHADWLLAQAPLAAGRLAQPLLLDSTASTPHASALATALHAIEDECAAARPWRAAQCSAWLGVLLLQLARQALAQEPHSTLATAAGTAAAHVDRFISLLEQHYRQQHEPGWYARALGLSTTHLTRLCQARLAAPARVLIQRRIVAEAKRDLVFSQLSIKQIALTLGFDDPAHFTRFFTAAAGCTPTAFRSRQLG